jgi:hypothetical protein
MTTFFIRTPGASLSIDEKIQFETIKGKIDRCCNDLLISPIWETSIECVDIVNTIRSPPLMNEIFFLIRQKFGSRQTPKSVFLALTLAETLVKNGGSLVHKSISDYEFMNDLKLIARKYVGKSGTECREVAELVLDIVQGWGEAFLGIAIYYLSIAI